MTTVGLGVFSQVRRRAGRSWQKFAASGIKAGAAPRRATERAVMAGLALAIGCAAAIAAPGAPIQAELLWRCQAQCGSAEIGAFDAATGRIFATGLGGVSVVDAATGAGLDAVPAIPGYECNSVATHHGVVAVAWAAIDRRQRGQVVLYDARTLAALAAIRVGHNPDMLAFTADGQRIVCANEGEPTDDYLCDPEGSVTVVDVTAGDWAHAIVRHIGFADFDPQRDSLRSAGVRIYAPSWSHPDGESTVAEDVEPEYLAVSGDGRRAWVTLQENNAIAELDLQAGRVATIHPLGLKKFDESPSTQRNPFQYVGLDVSDQDGGLHLLPAPVYGLYDPDAIAVIEQDGDTYLLTANEGDARKYTGFNELCRVCDLAGTSHPLDPQCDRQIPVECHRDVDRLMVTTAAGDTDGDGDIDQLCSVGARSFSIWRRRDDGSLERVFDSGSQFEQVLSEAAAERYVRHGDQPCLDDRSPLSGPEPEGLTIGMVGEQRLAFISLERASGVMVYDVTDPLAPEFVQYLPPCIDGNLCDIAPEGMVFIAPEQSPTGRAMLVVCNEVSGTLTAYDLAP
ncbi:MAG: alkaline phosphatase [Planctomycetaceae bacterium]|nr:alkaline phosphatase [Planctomycetaceae bacterium]